MNEDKSIKRLFFVSTVSNVNCTNLNPKGRKRFFCRERFQLLKYLLMVVVQRAERNLHQDFNCERLFVKSSLNNSFNCSQKKEMKSELLFLLSKPSLLKAFRFN